MGQRAVRIWGGERRRRALLLVAALMCPACAGPMAETLADPLGGSPRFDSQIAPSSPLGSYLAGRFAIIRRDGITDWTVAADRLAETLAADPDNRALTRHVFLYSVGAGRIERALGLADRITEDDPEYDIATLLRAADTLKGKDAAAAVTAAEAIPSRTLGQFASPLILAWARHGAGDTDGALAALEPLEKLQGTDGLLLAQRLRLLEMAGRIDEADPLVEPLRDTGLNLRTVDLIGGFLERQGRPAEAEAFYQEAIEQAGFGPISALASDRLEAAAAPALPADAASALGEALFDLAALLEAGRDESLALLLTRVARHLDPDDPAIRLLLGEIHASNNRHEEAIEDFDAIDSPWLLRLAQFQKAQSLEALERTEEAVALLRQIVGAEPERPDALVYLGDLLRRKERWSEAIDVYDRAIGLIETPQPRHWTLFYHRGIALERARRWDAAEKDFLTALDLEPDQPFVLNYLGYTWADKGIRVEEALAMIETAVQKRPYDGFIVDSLGWAQYRLGRYDEAVETLERAIALEPTDPTINDHLGDAYWKVGRRNEARFQWERALNLGDPDEHAEVMAAARRKLEQGLPELTSASDTSARGTR